MTIHPVISIVQFEPAFNTPDPFGRTDNKKPPPVRIKDDDAFEYKIKRLVKKRLVKNRLQYFVKWKKYGNEHNTWYDIGDFGNVGNAINDFEELNAHFPTRPRR